MRVFDFGKAGADARAVLTGMIIGDRVCGAVAQKWSEEGLFDSQFMDRVGGWCVDHYRKYNKAPGKQILIYHRRYAAKKSRPDEESKAVDDLLGSMNEEYIRKEKKHLQSDYLIGLASDLFTAVMIRRKTERARDYADAGKLDKAVAELAQTDKVDMTSEEMTSILEDPEAVRASFEEQSEPLVVYPGAAGHFFKNRLKRRAFVAFEGPEKVGKSFWILDVAWRGMQQGRRVAYFECGDMPREEVVMRIAARACRRAVDPAETEDGVYQFPVSIEPGESSTEVVHEDRRITQRMTHEEANRAFRKTTTKYGTDLFKLSCHSTKSLSVEGIHEILKRQKARYGWVPDIVAVDYADIVAPSNGTADTRDQINHTWAMFRALAMNGNCLVVTATQANRGSYNADVIGMEHTGEDKRKASHVSLFVGINQNDTERDRGVYRLNTPFARSGKHDKRRCLTTAGCLAVANPCILSVY